MDINDEKRLREFLTLLCKAPDSQIDKTLTDKLKAVMDKDVETIKNTIGESIDLAVFGSLSSGFALMMLQDAFVMAGGSKDDFKNDELCPWRNEKEKNN